MKPFRICQPDESKAACWLRGAVLGLLGVVALLSVVLSFAVEFMAAADLQAMQQRTSVSRSGHQQLLFSRLNAAQQLLRERARVAQAQMHGT